MPETQSTAATITVLAPLPVPQPNAKLHRIRKPGQPQTATANAALIPLFYAALFYLCGIVLTHFVYLRSGLLLAGLPMLAAVTITAIYSAPRLVWLPMAALWLTLGAWSGETEPQRAPGTISALSDGLLRTVEGTVVATEPMRRDTSHAGGVEDQDEDGAPDAVLPRSDTAGEGTAETQQIDLLPSAAEVITDASDQMQAIAPEPAGQAVADRIRITVHWAAGAGIREFACGERMRAVMRLQTPEVFHEPGVWDRAATLETQQIAATASLMLTRRGTSEARLQVSDGALNDETLHDGTMPDETMPDETMRGQPLRASLACMLNQFRNRAISRLQSLPVLTSSLPRVLRASPADAAMLTALLTGDRAWLNRGIRSGFERTGSFHLIVVSGLHLAILAGLVFAATRKLRLERFPATLLTLAITLAYALFTGFAVPVQRSFWMIALYLAGRLLYRGRSPLNVLGFAVLCLAAASPRSIFDASFQMTLLAVGTIAGVAAPLLEGTLHARIRSLHQLRLIALDARLPPPIAQFRVGMRMFCDLLSKAIGPPARKATANQPSPPGRTFFGSASPGNAFLGAWIAWSVLPAITRFVLRLGELLFVTLLVELALALPMAIYFHRITVYALPVNLFILPLLTVLVPAAMLLLLAVSVWPAVAVLPAAACLAVLHLSLFFIHRLGNFSLADFRVPEPSTLQTAAVWILFPLALQLARSRWPRFPHIGRRIAFGSVLFMAVAALLPRAVEHPADALLFEAIDVGQGDSLLLITPEGRTLLVDGGGLGLPFRAGGAASATPSFDTGEEIVSPVLWSRGIRRLDAVALTHAHHDHLGGLAAILRNFRPRELWVGNNPPASDYVKLLGEAASLGVIVRSLRAGETVALGSAKLRVLAPSASYHPRAEPANNDSLVLQASYGRTSVLLTGDAEAPEEQGMTAGFDLHSSVLKVGHHGSVSSTHPAFLAAVAPQWAVISCGRHNRFGHPRQEILDELQAAHVRTYRTDVNGPACFYLDGTAVTAEAMCAPRRRSGP